MQQTYGSRTEPLEPRSRGGRPRASARRHLRSIRGIRQFCPDTSKPPRRSPWGLLLEQVSTSMANVCFKSWQARRGCWPGQTRLCARAPTSGAAVEVESWRAASDSGVEGEAEERLVAAALRRQKSRPLHPVAHSVLPPQAASSAAQFDSAVMLPLLVMGSSSTAPRRSCSGGCPG